MRHASHTCGIRHTVRVGKSERRRSSEGVAAAFERGRRYPRLRGGCAATEGAGDVTEVDVAAPYQGPREAEHPVRHQVCQGLRGLHGQKSWP